MCDRREFIGIILVGTCLTRVGCKSVVPHVPVTERELPELPPEISYQGEENVVAARATWSGAQTRGRRRLEWIFRRKGIPKERREQCFVGLVYAAREGHRGNEMLRVAGEYCKANFNEPEEEIDWFDLLVKIAQFMAAVLTIILLFI